MDHLPGTASLLGEVDKKMIVILRDGKKLIGYLRSFDQFANLVLQDTVERIYVGDRYGDIPRGIYLVRGENVVLLGEIDLEKEETCNLKETDIDDILTEQREQQDEVDALSKLKHKVMLEHGLPPLLDPAMDDIYS